MGIIWYIYIASENWLVTLVVKTLLLGWVESTRESGVFLWPNAWILPSKIAVATHKTSRHTPTRGMLSYNLWPSIKLVEHHKTRIFTHLYNHISCAWVCNHYHCSAWVFQMLLFFFLPFECTWDDGTLWLLYFITRLQLNNKPRSIT